MAARAIWKGILRFDKVELPVKLYAAALDSTIHFHLLHRKDLVRVRQRMVHPTTGKEVPPEKIRKGFEVEPGRYVVLDDAELEAVEPKASRDIRVERFVDASAIDPARYDHPYWLGPDGSAARYAALADVLAREGKQGVASWVMRKQEYAGALHARDGHLMLITLRAASEVIPLSELSAPPARGLSDKEKKMADQLVAALEDEFDPQAWHDDYRKRVLELIETKARGGKLKRGKPFQPPVAAKSLAGALEASLAAARGRTKRSAHG